MGRKGLSLLLAIALLLGMLPAISFQANAQTVFITDRSLLDGNDYTSSSALAEKLNGIFDGNASIYTNSSCTKLVDARIGTSNLLNNNVYQYVGPYGGPYIKAGTSCWIYANGVYYTLFGECTNNNAAGTVGYPEKNSDLLNLSGTSSRYASYENFKAWGVRSTPGALIRAQNHSMIVLSYDEDQLIIVDGNGNSRGLVSVRVRSWSDVTFRVDYIIQPKEEYYNSLYPSCDHQYNGIGVCTLCQASYKWEKTFDDACMGLYTVSAQEAVSVHPEAPYSASPASTGTLAPETSVSVLGSVTNAFGETWYKISSQNLVGYVKAEQLSYTDCGPQQITCSLSAPAEGEIVPKRSYPMAGSISSMYPLAEVNAYIDGTLYTTVTLGSQTDLTIRSSAIDNKLSFSSLAVGEHTLVLTARDIYHSEPETVCVRTFVTESGASVCSHDYTETITKSPSCTESGEKRYTCQTCGASYTEELPQLQYHSFAPFVETEPTCVNTGLKRYTCQSCSMDYTQVIPATGEHTYESQPVAATCKEYAKTLYTCTVCEDSYVEDVPLTMSDWVTEHPEDADGLESRQEYRYREKEYTSSAEQTLEGWTMYDCATQWGEYSDWTDWSQTPVTEDEATQVQTRTAYKYGYYLCPGCGAHMYAYDMTCPSWAGGCGKVTLQLEDYVTVWSTISYDEADLQNYYGVGRYYTTIDGQIVFRPREDATQTQYRSCTRELEDVYLFYRWTPWTDWSVDAAEAKEDRQIEERTVYRYITSALGDHKYSAAVTAPTCAAPGYTTYSCQVCGDSYVGDHTEPTSHSYQATVTEPTCTEKGFTTYSCENCSDSYVDDYTDPAPHSYGAVVTAPSCTLPGFTTYTCKNCPDSYVDDYTDMIPHSFAEGFCSVCGAEDEDAKPVLAALIVSGQQTATYKDFAQAVAEATQTGAVLRLMADVETDCTATGDLWLDLNGYDLTGISVTGTIYGMDTATNSYKAENAGVLTPASGTVAAHVKTTRAQLGAVYRYLSIPEGNSYSFHRFYFGVTHVVLQPDQAGMGYRAAFAGDSAVRAYLDTKQAFGLVLKANAAPADLSDGSFAHFPASAFAQEGAAISKKILLQGVLDPNASLEDQTANAQTKIYACSFLKTHTGEVILSSPVSLSFRDAVALSDKNFSSASLPQQRGLLRLFDTYQTLMESWDLSNMTN